MGIDTQLDSFHGVASIQFCGRSGSYLLSNLLDSHPNLLSCPPHSLHNAFDKIHSQIAMSAQKGSKGFVVKNFVSDICKTFPMLFELDSENLQQQEKFLGQACHNMTYGVSKNQFCVVLEKYI